MKKIILLIISILVVGLVGCKPKTDVTNNDNEILIQSEENIIDNNKETTGENENNELSGESLMQEKETTEEELVKKYRLSDSYVLKEEEIKRISFDVLDNLYNNETQKYEIVVAKQEVLSDGKNFKIECTKVNENEQELFELKINDKTFEITDQYGTVRKLNPTHADSIGIIDMDPLDKYKEMVVSIGAGMDSEVQFYKLTNEGIELIYRYITIGTSDIGVVIVKQKCIIPVFANMVNDNLVVGYYTYEDGEFKFIDRFLTGEKIKDEKENYPENFKNQVFTAQSEGSIYCPAYYEGNIVNINGKVKILKQTKSQSSISGYIYDVELVEDTTIWIEEQQIILPKGTVLAYNQ